MMYCRNCGKEISDQAVVCVGCGVPPRKARKYCHSCGRETNEAAEVCIHCGVGLRGGFGQGASIGEALSGVQENTWAMLCHLLLFFGFLGPLLIWLIKGKESALIEDQGKEAINFHITMVIYGLPSWLLSFVYIGIPLIIALAIFAPVVTIMGSVRAYSGERYRYPLAIRLIR